MGHDCFIVLKEATIQFLCHLSRLTSCFTLCMLSFQWIFLRGEKKLHETIQRFMAEKCLLARPSANMLAILFWNVACQLVVWNCFELTYSAWMPFEKLHFFLSSGSQCVSWSLNAHIIFFSLCFLSQIRETWGRGYDTFGQGKLHWEMVLWAQKSHSCPWNRGLSY